MKKILIGSLALSILISTVHARDITPNEIKGFSAQAYRIDFDKAPADIQVKLKDEYTQKIKLSEILVQRYQNDPEFVQIRENIALELWSKRVMNTVKPTEEEIKKVYEASGELKVASLYKARHILVKQESIANELLSQLNTKSSNEQNALFLEMVQKHSVDGQSKNNGGDIGWIDSGKISPSAATELKEKEKGSLFIMRAAEELWEVIILDDIKPEHIASYDEAKPFLVKQLQSKTLQDEAAKLLKPTPANKSKVPSPKK